MHYTKLACSELLLGWYHCIASNSVQYNIILMFRFEWQCFQRIDWVKWLTILYLSVTSTSQWQAVLIKCSLKYWLTLCCHGQAGIAYHQVLKLLAWLFPYHHHHYSQPFLIHCWIQAYLMACHRACLQLFAHSSARPLQGSYHLGQFQHRSLIVTRVLSHLVEYPIEIIKIEIRIVNFPFIIIFKLTITLRRSVDEWSIKSTRS